MEDNQNSNTNAIARLKLERKHWRKNHKWGFAAVPKRSANGTIDYFHWKCMVPGPEGSPWGNGCYRLSVLFGSRYPAEPPVAIFEQPLYHPNVDETGSMKIDMLRQNCWHSAYIIRDVLHRINHLLDIPEMHKVVNYAAANDYVFNNEAYNERIRVFALTTRHSEE